MSTKFLKSKIILISVILLIVPMFLSAAGTREANEGEAITLDSAVMGLLMQVDSGELTLDEAKAIFVTLEKEYQVSTQARKQVEKMLEDVDSDAVTPEECTEQLKAQLHIRKRVQDGTQDQVQDQTMTQSTDGKGNNNGSATDKK